MAKYNTGRLLKKRRPVFDANTSTLWLILFSTTHLHAIRLIPVPAAEWVTLRNSFQLLTI